MERHTCAGEKPLPWPHLQTRDVPPQGRQRRMWFLACLHAHSHLLSGLLDAFSTDLHSQEALSTRYRKGRARSSGELPWKTSSLWTRHLMTWTRCMTSPGLYTWSMVQRRAPSVTSGSSRNGMGTATTYKTHSLRACIRRQRCTCSPCRIKSYP